MATPHPLDRLVERFNTLTDPRVQRQQRHRFSEVVVLTIIAFLGNCNDWAAVERFGHTRLAWLRTFLKLENGIPSHDTIGRVFAMLRTTEFAAIWEEWMREVCAELGFKQVAIDGKTMRSSGHAERKPLHVVTAFATENRLTLAQEVVDEKSNEITAIPELLRRLDISRALVTIDAMGCQKTIAAQIRQQDADYLLGVKGNQPKLLSAIDTYVLAAFASGLKDVSHSMYQQVDDTHGRSVERTCYVFDDLAAMSLPTGWRDLKSVVMVVCDRTASGKREREVRYYISSRRASAQAFLEATRCHWEIENGLHWVLDVQFEDDDSRLREGNGPENAALLKRIAISILKNVTVGKEKWVSGKRQLAGLDSQIMESIIQQFLEF
jgi:predicted transposase YbfD/YdcC